MKISIVTDEISADPETAIELGVEWGVSSFELRGFGSDRVPLLNPFQKGRIRELMDEFDVQIVAISPGLFKCPFPLGPRERFPLRTLDQALFERWRQPRDLLKFHQEELLPLSIEYAREIGAEKIVTFGFERGSEPGPPVPDEILTAFWQAAEQISRASLEMVIEVEAGFWIDTGQNAAAVLRAVDHPALGINWDPGNAIVAGDTPHPDGYEAVRDFVKHVHFKDVSFGPDGSYQYVLDGDIDWAGQISALAADGYAGFISVETHMEPKVRCARAMTERLQRLVSQYQ
ncbi:MAG: sugar phosphate isomerase/epimerase [Chloroflexi bacterium]|nr:sugar phosphate isomerase/epimerase [Chloroflexota bacterium]MCI0578071.1 sugar phosphate isomerase/epimerase [Chloroflexota bacterium]MCI0646059.1 sugar phosphate isomerase/epimerase [Chloroflexota bacterium]MCI0731003.1 sugar phosphate isomerase/epimerase [Chloroflexota bacterium]